MSGIIGGHFGLTYQREFTVVMIFLGGEGEGATECGAGETAGVLIGDGGLDGLLLLRLGLGGEEVCSVDIDCLG